jgi:hypothetical protein
MMPPPSKLEWFLPRIPPVVIDVKNEYETAERRSVGRCDCSRMYVVGGRTMLVSALLIALLGFVGLSAVQLLAVMVVLMLAPVTGPSASGSRRMSGTPTHPRSGLKTRQPSVAGPWARPTLSYS